MKVSCLLKACELRHALLYRSLENKSVEFDRRIDDLTFSESRAAVRFSDGKSVNYDLVIAADGTGSGLWRFITQSPPVSLEIVCWRLVTENTHDIKGWTATLGRSRTLLGIPIGPSGLLHIWRLPCPFVHRRYRVGNRRRSLRTSRDRWVRLSGTFLKRHPSRAWR